MFHAVDAGSTAAAGAHAAGAHLVAHALFKSLLFLAAGAAIHAVGGSDMGRPPPDVDGDQPVDAKPETQVLVGPGSQKRR